MPNGITYLKSLSRTFLSSTAGASLSRYLKPFLLNLSIKCASLFPAMDANMFKSGRIHVNFEMLAS
jgi:hypothetical protein